MPELPLPHVRVDQIAGLLEVLGETSTPITVPRLSQRLRLPADDLLPVIEAARLLDFARVSEDTVSLTDTGASMARADIHERRAIFRRQVARLPLVHQVVEILAHQPRRRLPRQWLMRWLGPGLSILWATRTIDTLINWGRYADILGYDARSGEIYLADDPSSPHANSARSHRE